MCLYLQWSTFHIYAMSPIPHVILTVYIGVSEGGMRGDSIATIGSQVPTYIFYSKFDKHQYLIFVYQSILVMEYPNSVTDM